MKTFNFVLPGQKNGNIKVDEIKILNLPFEYYFIRVCSF